MNVRPEDYGAVGDGATDDTDAWEAMCADWPPEKPVGGWAKLIELAVGATYKLTRSIQLCADAPHTTILFRGNAANVTWFGTNADPAIKLGDGVERRGYRCFIEDLTIRDPRGAQDRIGGGLDLSACDFTQLRNVSVGGGSPSAIHVGHANSLSFYDVSAAGADIGVLFDSNEATNVFNWRGGKVQQCRVGVQHKGTVWRIEGVDFSLCSEWAIATSGSHGRIDCYTESLGPKTDWNHSGAYLLQGARHVDVRGRISCVNGSWGHLTHAAYGVKCEGAEAVTIRGQCSYPLRAFVDVDDACRGVRLLKGSGCESGSDDSNAPQPCTVADGVRFTNEAALALDDFAPSVAPTIATWSTYQQAYESAGVLSFPITNPWGGFSTALPLPEGRYRLEMRARLDRFHLPEEQQTRGMGQLRLLMRQGQRVETRYPRLGPGWADYAVDFDVDDSGASLLVYVLALTGGEPIDVATEFVRVVEVKP